MRIKSSMWVGGGVNDLRPIGHVSIVPGQWVGDTRWRRKIHVNVYGPTGKLAGFTFRSGGFDGITPPKTAGITAMRAICAARSFATDTECAREGGWNDLYQELPGTLHPVGVEDVFSHLDRARIGMLHATREVYRVGGDGVTSWTVDYKGSRCRSRPVYAWPESDESEAVRDGLREVENALIEAERPSWYMDGCDLFSISHEGDTDSDPDAKCVITWGEKESEAKPPRVKSLAWSFAPIILA